MGNCRYLGSEPEGWGWAPDWAVITAEGPQEALKAWYERSSYYEHEPATVAEIKLEAGSGE